MTELQFWCVFSTGIFVGCVFGMAAYACWLAPAPKRNYGVPKRSAEIVVLDHFRKPA